MAGPAALPVSGRMSEPDWGWKSEIVKGFRTSLRFEKAMGVGAGRLGVGGRLGRVGVRRREPEVAFKVVRVVVPLTLPLGLTLDLGGDGCGVPIKKVWESQAGILYTPAQQSLAWGAGRRVVRAKRWCNARGRKKDGR